MKKSVLFFLGLFAISSLLLSACSKDEDDNNDDPQTLAERFPGVPIGDIVPVEERESILTGSFKSTDSTERKYWKFEESKAKISGCGISDEQNLLDQSGYDGNAMIAFGKDMQVYVKSGGNVMNAGGWQWDNTETKSGIILDTYPSVVFTFTELNASQVVYASKQTGAYEGCDNTTIITYERLASDGGNDPPATNSYFKYDGVKYPLDIAKATYDSEDPFKREIYLVFASEGVNIADEIIYGTGDALWVYIYSPESANIPSGEYGLEDYFFIYLNHNFTVYGTDNEIDFYAVDGSVLDVNRSGSTYTFEINTTDDETGKPLELYYKGSVDF